MNKVFSKNIGLLIISLALVISSCQQSDPPKTISSDTISVIPQPKSIEASEGNFILPENSIIQYQGLLKTVAENLNQHLGNKGTVQELKPKTKGQILLSATADEALGEEGYELIINKNGIEIKGNPAGVFYGVQTLIQLLVQKEGQTVLPYVHIKDQPRFTWRGMHFDVSRHFFDKEFIKKYIDILAKHKLNVFHWHLTDDQGWRVAIDSYPRLTSVAAWRAGNGMEKWDYDIHAAVEGQPKYGGYYTKDDIREVLAYAEERFVTVLPEIELPGHSWGVLSAYPNLSCTGKEWHMGESWSFTDPFCVGNEETFTFFEKVFKEVIELFPSPYIHIGGDEAQKTIWDKCSKCQNRIKEEGLEGVDELQSYFIKRIEKIVQSKGRKIIGWDEILDGGLAPDATVMSWRGEEGGIKAAKQKHEVIMVPAEFLYFDHPQYDAVIEGTNNTGILDLKTIYNYNPVPDELTTEEQKYIKGVQACLWTEYVLTEASAFDRVLPRISALSEIAWVANEDKDWDQFKEKLPQYFAFLGQQDIDFFIAPPSSNNHNTFIGEQTEIELSSTFPNPKIYYTLDGSEPTNKSNLYQAPITVKDNTTLKAKIILPSKKESATFEKTFHRTTYQEAVDVENVQEGILLEYYKGSISQLSQFHEMKTLKKPETVTSIIMPEGMPDDHFGLQYSGYIKIPKDGIYTFYTSSDDGSGLYINNKMVVNNDGFHGMQEENGEIALKTGYHKLLVTFFEGGGGEGLTVKMQGPDLKKGTVKSSMLFLSAGL